MGTEMRQLTLNTPEMQDKETFRDILVSDGRRRHYVIDADVERQTLDLMSCGPRPDESGAVKPTRLVRIFSASSATATFFWRESKHFVYFLLCQFANASDAAGGAGCGG